MKNDEIIANEAVYSGFFTEDEVKRIISEGRDLPFHTYGTWKNHFNMIPKRGTHGWSTKLWRHRMVSDNDKESNENGQYYLTKATLFHISQVEPIQSNQPVKPLNY